jgi:hypothetical protein
MSPDLDLETLLFQLLQRGVDVESVLKEDDVTTIPSAPS